jgi:hypothetical protein
MRKPIAQAKGEERQVAIAKQRLPDEGDGKPTVFATPTSRPRRPAASRGARGSERDQANGRLVPLTSRVSRVGAATARWAT